MFFIERSVVRGVRFDKSDKKNKWITPMLLDKLAGVLFQKFWLRYLERKRANETARERVILTIGSDPMADKKTAVVADIFGRNPIAEAALGGGISAKMPLAHVSAVIIFIL